MIELKIKDDRKSKPTRPPISPRTRFKVLQRDGFTCQYCGSNGQETELEIDHIIPISKRGTNEVDNLITACKKCNRGKFDSDILNINVNNKIPYDFNSLEEEYNQLIGSRCVFPEFIIKILNSPQTDLIGLKFLCLNILKASENNIFSWSQNNKFPIIQKCSQIVLLNTTQERKII